MKDLITSILMFFVFTIALGLLYPLGVWCVGQAFFSPQANGSLIKDAKGEIIGSELIEQNFTGAEYFHARLSANNYDAANSGGSNLGPTSQKLIERIKNDAKTWQAENPDRNIPADLITTSASGLDPHISPAAADFQILRVAKARGMSETKLRKLVAQFTEDRQFGIFGEPRVNVLKLNLELNEINKKAE